MAIAFETGSNTTLTVALTTSNDTTVDTGTGENRGLIIGFAGDTTSDLITGVTYAGVAATQIGKVAGSGGLRWVYLYYLPNPASGSNTLTITASSNCYQFGSAYTVTGVQQTTTPDASGTQDNAAATSATLTLTTVKPNCWMFSYILTNGVDPSAGSGTVDRTPASDNYGHGDSNSALTAGSNSLNWTFSNATSKAVFMSLAPAASLGDIANSSSLTTSLVSYWELEETSGTRSDAHGSNDLTDNNTVTSGGGKQGLAADFESGNSEYLSVADTTDLRLTGNFSIAGWFNLESTATTLGYSPSLISKENGSGGWNVRFNAGDNKLEIVEDDTNAYQTTTAFSTTGTWYHFAITYGGSNVRLYVNGVKETDTAYAGHTSVTADLEIGRSNRYTTRYFDGLVDQMGIWTKQLSDTEVIELYNYGNGLPYDATGYVSTDSTLPTGLTAYWQLEETSGTRTDEKGSWDLTDTNTVTSTTGIQGTAAFFTSANSEVLLTASNFTGYGTAAVSVMAWVKTTADNGTDYVIGMNDGATETFALFCTAGDNVYELRIHNGVTNADSPSVAESSVNDGNWHQLVGVYDGAYVKLFFDGAEVGSPGTAFTGNINTTGPDKLGIGARNGGGTPGLYWDGAVDEAAVWNRALSAGEVERLYNAGSGIPYAAAAATSTPLNEIYIFTGKDDEKSA